MIAKDTAKKNGYNYDIKISIGNYPFPTKTYGDISLPAGYYDALKVKIGEAKGRNWWCVMFPTLCFVDISNGVIPEDFESDGIWAKAVFIHELAEFESNFRTKFS